LVDPGRGVWKAAECTCRGREEETGILFGSPWQGRRLKNLKLPRRFES